MLHFTDHDKLLHFTDHDKMPHFTDHDKGKWSFSLHIRHRLFANHIN